MGVSKEREELLCICGSLVRTRPHTGSTSVELTDPGTFEGPEGRAGFILKPPNDRLRPATLVALSRSEPVRGVIRPAFLPCFDP